MSNNLSNSNNLTKIKSMIMITAIASILMVGMSMNSAAHGSLIGSDMFPKIDDIGQSAECVGVNVGCDKGVGFGDVNIGGRQATLNVVFLVDCQSTGGQPSDVEVCDRALEIASPSAFLNTITANNPNPSTFAGSSTGTIITLGAGNYLIDTDIGIQDELKQGLNTEDVSFDMGASGGACDNPESGTAQGTIRTGETQTCIIQTTIVVGNGNVAGA